MTLSEFDLDKDDGHRQATCITMYVGKYICVFNKSVDNK